LIDTKLCSNDFFLFSQPKQLTPKEINSYIKLLRYSLVSLEVFNVNRVSNNCKSLTNSNNSLVNQKDEKEVLENLGYIFSYFNHSTLKYIFKQSIDLIVEQTIKNPNLTILTSYFLATPATSCIYSTILLENLLTKMEIMGEASNDKSNLFLKLFKLVFGSVSVFPSENEKMLKPHLHVIVNNAIKYALRSKEPYNYFLLMRALFRSIGGGNHDLLYQEFLPLLPILLQSLNELQTGHYKQHLKDLFVELCLTVPVRLSSLLPYLPMLMDPLVSALNGSPTLISQVSH
jgi:transformation/transcription domain-associated protein